MIALERCPLNMPQEWSLRRALGSAYRLEPIVRLEDDSLLGGEVLRHGRRPISRYGWRNWYSRIGGLQGIYGHEYPLFVNLDTDQILEEGLMDKLLNRIPKPAKLVLEWTEKSASMMNLERAGKVLQRLRAQWGLRVCVDDFGAGMDGIRRLQLCNPDIVKIDGNLLHAARHHAATRVLYQHIAALIKDAGAQVVAEWIEDRNDLEFARSAGVDYGQGFYWPYAQGRI